MAGTKGGKFFTQNQMSQVAIRPLRWIWKGFLPLGNTVLWAGEGDAGKSTALAELAARITKGRGFPGGDANLLGRPADVLLLNDEDSEEESIAPKLIVAEADLKRVFRANGIENYKTEENGYVRLHPDVPRETILDLFEQAGALEHWMEDHPETALIVIDPVTAYLGNRDANNNEKVKQFVARLQAVATKYGPCILMVTHLNKNPEQVLKDKVMGSAAWRHGPRMNFLVVRDQEEEIRGECVSTLVPSKANICKRAPARRFRIEGRELMSGDGNIIEVPLTVWDQQPVAPGEGPVVQAAAMAPAPRRQQKGRWGEREQTKEWVWKMLTVPIEAGDLKEAAEQNGFGWRRVQRALTDMQEDGLVLRLHDEGNTFTYSKAAATGAPGTKVDL
jgi:hypothetical protein